MLSAVLVTCLGVILFVFMGNTVFAACPSFDLIGDFNVFDDILFHNLKAKAR
jgi:hypothetical protein